LTVNNRGRISYLFPYFHCRYNV